MKDWFSSKKLERCIVALVLTLVGATQLYLARTVSLTTDEGIHTASGYLALVRHDFRFDPEHPFLSKFLFAAPLLALDLNLPKNDQALWNGSEPVLYDSWRESREWTEQWFYKSGNNTEQMLFWSRVPAVAITVLLVWSIYWITRRWFGRTSALLALALAASTPIILGHGYLTNNDVGIALAVLWSIYSLWIYGSNPTVTNAALAGLSLGLVLNTKHSGIIMVVVAALYLISLVVRKKITAAKALAHGVLAACIIWALIWICYFFTSPTTETTFVANYRYAELVRDWGKVTRFILPTLYLKGLVLVGVAAKLGRPTWILGENYGQGVWYYFPVAFFFKTALAGSILAVTGLLLLAKRAVARVAWNELTHTLIVAVGILCISIFTNKLNIGLRHAMVLIPFAIMLMAWSLAWILAQVRARQRAVLATIVLSTYIIPTVLSFPDLMSFFDPVLVRPERAWWYLHDSNLDWGQQAAGIARVTKTEFSTTTVRVNYIWSPYALEHYGITANGFDPSNPPKGELIIVTGTQRHDPAYAAFNDLTPTYRIATHTFFYLLQ